MNEDWLKKSLSKKPLQIELLENIRRFALRQEFLELYQKVYESKDTENKLDKFKTELEISAKKFVS